MNSKKFFLEALKLAESVKGLTSPNPAVGCVLAKGNRIISRGATLKAGLDHAEMTALKKAGHHARNASLYVILEPCVDYPGKKTASCSTKIIESGIREVFVGMKDPNPRVNGRGLHQLRKAGVKVHILNEFRKEIQVLNEDFFKFIQTGVPFVTAKAAITLDGNIAASDGDSQWISGVESRKWVHQLRNRVDAVLVGIGTVLKDNPQLNVRLVKKIKDPLRIIVDANGRTPPDSHVMSDEGRTLFIVKKGIAEEFKDLCRKNKKDFMEFETHPDPDSPQNKIFNFMEIFKQLGTDKSIESVLMEGGGTVFHRALQDGAIDKLAIFIAPKILGGKGIPLFNGEANLTMSEAIKLNDISVENIGEDIFIQGYL